MKIVVAQSSRPHPLQHHHLLSHLHSYFSFGFFSLKPPKLAFQVCVILRQTSLSFLCWVSSSQDNFPSALQPARFCCRDKSQAGSDRFSKIAGRYVKEKWKWNDSSCRLQR
ncbi:hypothetical protein CRG98_044222, partial [Punica granatum]